MDILFQVSIQYYLFYDAQGFSYRGWVVGPFDSFSMTGKLFPIFCHY